MHDWYEHLTMEIPDMHNPSEMASQDEYAEFVPIVPIVPAMTTEAAYRKARPVCTGVLDYFPDALLEVAAVSRIGNDQHNPGQPLHWDKSKSQDEADALMRHLLERGTIDTDGTRHSAKVAWRALALLQREIDADGSGIGSRFPLAPVKKEPKPGPEFSISAKLPYKDTNGDIYDFRDSDLGRTILDAEHGIAMAKDFAENLYLGRVVTLWRRTSEGYMTKFKVYRYTRLPETQTEAWGDQVIVDDSIPAEDGGE